MCTIDIPRGKPFSAGGCPVPEGNTTCGETRTLDIIKEFKRLYEKKMEEIDTSNCGDCLQEKLKLQFDWINDLTEQNEMLVKAVEELEMEATERVKMLEDKLQKSAECICEIMKKYRENDVTTSLFEEPRKRVFNLENDSKNLLEFIRRIRDEQQWNTGGLTFYEITEKDLFGDKCEQQINEINECPNSDISKGRKKLKQQNSHIHQLEKKTHEVECLSKELKAKKEECDSLQKNMIDMRQALTEEVATKHDIILKLKREWQELEDRCIQADKQTAFRDDIIKGLRKEIKQLKQQASELELAKYKIETSLESMKTRMPLEENLINKNDVSKMSTFDVFMKELNKIAEPSFRDNYYSFMEKEIIELNKIIEIKHTQLQESFKLNKVLIGKLFSADNGLKFLEERALSALIKYFEKESSSLKAKHHELEEKNKNYELEKMDLLEKVTEAKTTIQSLEIQFNEFLQEREQLRNKYKSAAKQGSNLLEECNKIKEQNCCLKDECDKLKTEVETCCGDKILLEDTLKDIKMEFNLLVGCKSEVMCQTNQLSEENKKLLKELQRVREMNENLLSTIDGLKQLHVASKSECKCQTNKLSEENKKLLKELQRVREMNENLLSTIDGLRTQLHVASKVTSEEVIKLNKTVDVLQNALERGKLLHEEEEKEKKNENKKLRSTIKELESCICGCQQRIQNKSAEISKQNRNIQELEKCVCTLQNQLQIKHGDISTLSNRIKDLERYGNDVEQENPEASKDFDILKNRIRELENYTIELQSKGKLCKICKQNVRVSFTDCSEVQTDGREPTHEQIELLLNRDELIKYQSCTLEKMQQELQNVCEREKELLAEKQTFCKENCSLHNKLLILERKLNEAERTAQEISNKEEIIKKQKEALNILQREAECLRTAEAEMRTKNQEYCTCIQQLKNKVNELEISVENAEKRGNNLQTAVDLYMNTINVLEATEEKYKLEIDNQRTTIVNLQDVLVTTKQELNEYKQKYDDSEEDQRTLIIQFVQLVTDSEMEKELLKDQVYELSEKYEKLQDLNFNLEIEHCNSLQDVEGLDIQLFKYQTVLKTTEEELQICKSNLKKLHKQKRNFEKVVGYFKEEMATMSQQLQNLQDLLNMSHESSQKEANKLMESLVNLQQLNQKLSLQLAAAEQKVILENQINHLNQTKIAELERMIAEKDVDLHKHTSTIQSIKKSLQSSLQQNKELQQTISSLNHTIVEFQEIVRGYEEDNNKSKENTALCKTQIGVCRDKLLELNVILEQKTTELCTLECAYNQQHKSLKSCQIELNKFKEKQKTKQQYLKRVIEQLKNQLSTAQDEHKKVVERHYAVQKELGAMKCKYSAKDDEVDKYKKLVGELKVTLVELNDSLINQECNCHDEDSPEQSTNTSFEDASNCSCEIGYYLGIIESLKKATMQLMTNLSESQKQHVKLEKENNHKQSQIEEMTKAQLDKDKKYNELKQKLMDILKQSQAEEQHYIELTKTLHKEINLLKHDLEQKINQFKEAERNAEEVASSMSMELAAANEEVDLLKEQLNNLIRQQRIVNSQNDQLQNQNEFLNSKVATLEETGRSLRTQLEQYLVDIQKFQRDNETLQQKNHDLLCELRSLHASFEAVTSQKRYKEDTIKDLENKLNEANISRDEICFESKNAINYFRQWLQEQNRINKYIVSKEKNYCKTIDMMRHQIEDKQGIPCERMYTKPKNMAHPTCQGPCSLGSQGNDNESIYSMSPAHSPCPNPRQVDDCDWFAATYKNDSDSDEEIEEDWVSKVECLADQVKKTHKMWKQKMEKSDYTVTKDCKK